MQNHWGIWPSKGKRNIIADNYEMAQGKNKKNVEKDGGGAADANWELCKKKPSERISCN